MTLKIEIMIFIDKTNLKTFTKKIKMNIKK